MIQHPTRRTGTVLAGLLLLCLLPLLTVGCGASSTVHAATLQEETVQEEAVQEEGETQESTAVTVEEDFVPSEEVSADRSVSFPVDI